MWLDVLAAVAAGYALAFILWDLNESLIRRTLRSTR